jgi:hypothetical protein
MAKRYAVTRENGFWIASILIVLLLAIQVVLFTQVTQYSPSDLGLLTKLPITFWIGLSYLGVLLYLGRKSGPQTLTVLILVFFFLFVIPLLIRENKAEFLTISYGFSAMGTNLMSIGHLELSTLDFTNLLNWPGFFINAGILSGSTGLPATLFADYFPLLNISLYGLMVYGILRMQLNSLSSAFGTLWFIASFWTIQYYFAPQGMAYLYYFAIFFLLEKIFLAKKQDVTLPLAVLILFIGLVASHLLTSFAMTVGIIAIYVLFRFFPQKRKLVAFYSIVTCVLLVSILFAYQALVITSSFNGIIQLLLSQLTQGETQLSVISQGRAFISPALQWEIYGDYSITIINIVIALFAILATVIGLFLHKKEARNNLFWIAWIIVASLIGASVFYGGEVIQRAFLLMLLPISYFVAKLFSKKPRIMVFIVIIIMFLNIPAHYASQNWVYVPTSELEGCSFFERYSPSNASFLYEVNLGSFRSGQHNGTILSISYAAPGSSIPSSEIVEKIIGQADFIIYSSQTRNFYQYFYGVNLLENQNFVDNYSRVYDNECFQIYDAQKK